MEADTEPYRAEYAAHFPGCLRRPRNELVPVMSSGHTEPGVSASKCSWWPSLPMHGPCPASRSWLAHLACLLIWDALSNTCKPFPRKLNPVSYSLTSRITHSCTPSSYTPLKCTTTRGSKPIFVVSQTPHTTGCPFQKAGPTIASISPANCSFLALTSLSPATRRSSCLRLSSHGITSTLCEERHPPTKIQAIRPHSMHNRRI